MFKRSVVLIAASVLLTSCNQTKVGEQYASRMGEVLKTYRDQIDTKIEAEQQSYIDLARTYDAASAERIGNAVLIERNARASETVDRIIREKASSPHAKVAWISEIHSDLAKFAEFDFDQSHTLFAREVDAYKASIAGLADMAEEQTNLDKLKDSLESLAKPQSITEKLKAGAEFGCEVNRNYQVLDVSQKIQDLAGKIVNEAEAEKRASLQKQQSSFEDQRKKLQAPCAVN